MIKRCISVILCLILSSLLFTGCFDREELNEIGIVLAVALDKDRSTNDIIVSCEIVRPNELKEGSTERNPVEIVTAKGQTVFEAVRNISKKLDRKSYFAHNKMIIISEKLAEEGIEPVLDVFIRDTEIRLSVWLVVSKDMEARDLLNINHGLNRIQAFYINDIIKTKWATSQIQAVDLLGFYKKLLKQGASPTTGAMIAIKEFDASDIKLVGTAAFKKDKLVGYLNYKESRGLNWVTDEVKSGIINVPGLINEDKFTAIEILRSKGKIIPKLKDGEVAFTIQISVNANIGEVHDATDISDLKVISRLEEETKKVIEEEIKEAIDKAKNEFHSDIFGLGNTLSKYYPKKWESVKENWDDMFLKSKCEIDVKVQLRRTGQIQKPIKTKK